MALSSDERDELRATVRSLLSRESSPERVREFVAEPPGYDVALWQHMVELGWTSIHVPAERGGAGCGYGDLAVILHELGRAMTPSPFHASAVLATGALLLAEHRALADPILDVITAGDALGAVAFAGSDGSYDISRMTLSWRSAGGSVRLDGAAGFALDADLADVLVVAARRDDGVVAVFAIEAAMGGVHIEHTATVDPTRRLFTVSVADVVVGEERMLCEPGPPAERLLDQLLAIGIITASCDATGTAERALERTTEYARERTQFGKPIGSFQAVKHHCADMAIAVEASRAASAAAAEALDGDPAAWPTTAAITSSYVGPACSEACALALLVHGGIGFTWEADSHLYLKRVKLDEVLFGTPSWHRRRLADAVFPILVAS
jgi:alkylation response protein AidB-like acyl-CoA dehydrogenase